MDNKHILIITYTNGKKETFNANNDLVDKFKTITCFKSSSIFGFNHVDDDKNFCAGFIFNLKNICSMRLYTKKVWEEIVDLEEQNNI